MSEDLKNFSICFTDLVTYLKTSWPEDRDLNKLSLQLDAALGLDRTRVLQGFVDYVTLPYWREILEGDEEFFLSKSGHELGAESEMVDKIKELWQTLDEFPKKRQKIKVKCQQLIIYSIAATNNEKLKKDYIDFVSSS